MSIKRPVTVKEYVYEQIKSHILSGVYRPGQRLTETNLAEDLQVSRTPVRDALNRLETEGLISNVPHRGIFVTEITVKDVRDFYHTRTVLEGLAAKLAAMEATEEEIKEFKEFLLEAEDIFQRDKNLPNYKAIAECNNRFHKMICKMAKNEVLTRTLASLDSAITLIRSTSWTNEGRKYQTYLEHEEIADAIIQRKPELAQQKAEEHIISAWKSAEHALEANQQQHLNE